MSEALWYFSSSFDHQQQHLLKNWEIDDETQKNKSLPRSESEGGEFSHSSW